MASGFTYSLSRGLEARIIYMKVSHLGLPLILQENSPATSPNLTRFVGTVETLTRRTRPAVIPRDWHTGLKLFHTAMHTMFPARGIHPPLYCFLRSHLISTEALSPQKGGKRIANTILSLRSGLAGLPRRTAFKGLYWSTARVCGIFNRLQLH